MQHKKLRRGFTLIEVLVVVLIIGILAAIALPMYNKAVLRSRFNALMPIVKAMNDSNEAYFLEHGSYASNPQDLPVQGLSEYPTGTELEFGSNMDYAYVLASNASAKNNYIMYQKHSTNYPGEIHCEAITGDDLAEYICESAGGTNIGTTLTEGYTTYVLSGSGAGVPTGTFEEAEDNADPMSCDKAIAQGLTCNITTNEQGQTVKQMCKNGVCRTKTYNEDGSYTSITCQTNAENVCTNASNWESATYDANGNKLTERACSSIDSSGKCTQYYGGADYTYDANGNMLTQRRCASVDRSGNCTSYNLYSGYDDYTYDANGNKLTVRSCNGSVDSSGSCTRYTSGYDYTYDANGNMLRQRSCTSVDGSGNCTAYRADISYDYTYDANGNLLTERQCKTVDSNGTCTEYNTNFNYAYTYDPNGNKISRRTCSSVDSNGNCTAYSNSGFGYIYDANANQMTERSCSSFDSSGNCTSYSYYGYVYTYDASGNQLAYRVCRNFDSSNTCTEYGEAYYYTYDDNGKQIANQYCGGSNINTATGECTAYSNTNVKAN